MSEDTNEYDEYAYRDETVLRELYEDGLSQRQIAAKLGCAPNTVSLWMDKHEIPAGPHSEHYSINGKRIEEFRVNTRTCDE